jgi:hypothetical protein
VVVHRVDEREELVVDARLEAGPGAAGDVRRLEVGASGGIVQVSTRKRFPNTTPPSESR